MTTKSRKIQYAIKQLTLIGKENGFTPIEDNLGIYIEFPSGRNLRISESEIIYQAEEFLKSEIELLKF
jgi:hypothetical protein